MAELRMPDLQGVGKLLLAIYPPYILALILIPSIAGLFINYQLVEITPLGIDLIWIPFFTIPYYLSNKKVFYYLIVLLCFINGFVNLGHWIMVNGPISASSLFVLFNTNCQESLGFLGLKSSYAYLLLILYLLVFIQALRFPTRIDPEKRKYTYYLLGIIGFISLASVTKSAYNHRLIRKGVPVLLKSSISFYQEVNAYKALKEETQTLHKQIKATPLETANQQIFVLILGESTNRNHMSLYGYSRPTNPSLEKDKELIIYNNVVSAYSHTLNSVLSSLSQSNLENKMPFAKSFSLINVFKAAEFKTYWISNQSPFGVWDNLVTLLAQQSDVTRFVNISGNSSFENTYKTSYDSKLFQPLETALKGKGQRKFIVLHLMGCHSTYNKRYPSNFEQFEDNASKKTKTQAAYDNAVLYNDFVVDSLLKILKAYTSKTNALSAAIYLSDHGENVYDEYDYAGHDYAGNMSKNNVEIPFLVWLSPMYQKTLKEKSRLIAAHRHAPFVTDDLFHSIIDLFAIKTSVFEKERSVFNKAFNEQRKRILVDGKDYDTR